MWGLEVWLHTFLASTLGGGVWATTGPRTALSRERTCVLFGPCCNSARFGEVINFLALPAVETRTVQPLAWSLCRLRYPGSAYTSPCEVLIYKHAVLAGDFV